MDLVFNLLADANSRLIQLFWSGNSGSPTCVDRTASAFIPDSPSCHEGGQKVKKELNWDTQNGDAYIQNEDPILWCSWHFPWLTILGVEDKA